MDWRQVVADHRGHGAHHLVRAVAVTGVVLFSDKSAPQSLQNFLASKRALLLIFAFAGFPLGYKLMKGACFHWPLLRQGSEQWLQLRKKVGVTGSRLGAVLGLGYVSRNRYLQQKWGELPEDPINPLMQFGIDYEDWVAEMYGRWMREQGIPVQLSTDGFKLLGDDPRSGASVDRLVTDGKRKWVLEIKCKPRGDVRYEVPINHVLQCVFNAVVHGVEFSDYVSWSPECNEMFVARVHFDKDALWDKFLVHKVRDFNDHWQKHVLFKRMRPGEAKGHEAVVRAFTRTVVPCIGECKEVGH